MNFPKPSRTGASARLAGPQPRTRAIGTELIADSAYRESARGTFHAQFLKTGDLPPRSASSPKRSAAGGFTLVEVLVALAIVAIALGAGVKATGALTRNAERQSDVLLAQICAENELVKVRLSRQMPGIGDSVVTCVQGGRSFAVTLGVRPTPNPSFRRVDATVGDGRYALLKLSTIVGRY